MAPKPTLSSPPPATASVACWQRPALLGTFLLAALDFRETIRKSPHGSLSPIRQGNCLWRQLEARKRACRGCNVGRSGLVRTTALRPRAAVSTPPHASLVPSPRKIDPAPVMIGPKFHELTSKCGVASRTRRKVSAMAHERSSRRFSRGRHKLGPDWRADRFFKNLVDLSHGFSVKPPAEDVADWVQLPWLARAPQSNSRLGAVEYPA